MLFNSFHFLVYFPIVTVLYYTLPYSWRWPLLLIASCYFYISFIPKFIIILFALILVDYVAGIWMEDSSDRLRRPILVVSLAANISILVFFKYFNFFNDSFAWLAGQAGLPWLIPHLDVILPLGLSFHTFQSMAYTIEVYRRRQKAERNLAKYALYVLFYPQLVAGPIERPQHLLHQFSERHPFEYQRVTDGLKLMLWGMFKKVVIADRLAVSVNEVYDHLGSHTGMDYWIATYFFAYQIYCDFSGYTDIARGAAQVMGYELMVNFDRPYFSKSISEFWRRWHISLSTWFRDYLYIPLGGNRVSPLRQYFNLMVVFLVSGLWHGANWTFVIWGGLHGSYLALSKLTERLRERLPWRGGKIWDVALTFHLVCFAWIFFRAGSVSDALQVVKGILDEILSLRWLGLGLAEGFAPKSLIHHWLGGLGVSYDYLATTFLMLLILEIVQLGQRALKIRVALAQRPLWQRWTLYYSIISCIICFGQFKQQSFIYFQF